MLDRVTQMWQDTGEIVSISVISRPHVARSPFSSFGLFFQLILVAAYNIESIQPHFWNLIPGKLAHHAFCFFGAINVTQGLCQTLIIGV